MAGEVLIVCLVQELIGYKAGELVQGVEERYTDCIVYRTVQDYCSGPSTRD